MNQLDSQNSNNEFNTFNVDEIISNKEMSHETGEYNEIQFSNGLISTVEEESSSSESEDTTSKALAIGTSTGMVLGVVGIVIGTIVVMTPTLTIINDQSMIGISEAQCFFDIGDVDVGNIILVAEDKNGNKAAESSLLPAFPDQNIGLAGFFDLLPNSTYYIKCFTFDDEEVPIEGNISFTTLDIPNYDIEIDKSSYDRANGIYDLRFKIDNPNRYDIRAELICLNDENLNQSKSSKDGIYDFTLPNILSSYRLELYQEDYFVGQTTFTDYQGIELIDDSLEIGIGSFFTGFYLGEINYDDILASIVKRDDPNIVIPIEIAMDGNVCYAMNYNLEPGTDYIFKLRDRSNSTFTYYSYSFKTNELPHYNIVIDDSGFDIENNVYDLMFKIDNYSTNSYIEAELICLNDATLNDYYYFDGDILNLTLPSLYSEYTLNLIQEGFNVGSATFSYYTPMSIVSDTVSISASSFMTEVDLGSVPINNISVYLCPNGWEGDELELEILPVNDSRISLRMEGLLNNSSYRLEIRDYSRDTFIYLNYEFNTLA